MVGEFWNKGRIRVGFGQVGQPWSGWGGRGMGSVTVSLVGDVCVWRGRDKSCICVIPSLLATWEVKLLFKYYDGESLQELKRYYECASFLFV